MKRLKLLNIAVPAVLLAMALLGSSQASAATVVCAEAKTTCPSGSVEPANTAFVGLVNKSLPGTSFKLGMLDCSAGAFGTSTSQQAGNPLTGKTESLFSSDKCTFLGMPCTSVTMSEAPATLAATGSGNGTMTFGTTSSPFYVTYNCDYWGEEVNCKYRSTGAAFQFTASEFLLKATSQPFVKESGAHVLCAATPKLNATMEGLQGYLSSHSYTVVCAEAKTTCPNGSVEPANTAFVGTFNKETLPGTSFKLGLLDCSAGALGTTISQQFGDPLTGKTESLFNVGKCAIYGGPSCTSVTMSEAPATLAATGSGNGTMTLGTTSSPLYLTFKCDYWGEEVSCKYRSTGAAFQFTASEFLLKATSQPFVKESGAHVLCLANPNLNATMEGIQGYISSV